MTPAGRLGLLYAAIFIGTGVNSPYMPLWFAHHGLTGAQIGLMLSAPLLARAVTAPLLAVWADHFRLRRSALAWLCAVCGVAYLAMWPPLGFVWWLVVWFVASSIFATIAPLTDAFTLLRARRDGFNFGWPRGMGSVAFIIGNLVMGALLVRGSPDLVLVWITVAVALAGLVALWLPADPVHEEGARTFAERMSGLGGLLKDPVFMTAILSAGLIQSAHAFYYGFSTLAWKQQGISESLTGVLWALGVALEIAFLWFMEPLRRRLGPRWLLVIGGVAALVRWSAMAMSPPLWMLVPLQALHTLTYAATFLASLQLAEKIAGARNASAAQAINSALSTGVLSGLATLASGWLFDRTGAQGYLLMAAMSAAGLIGAIRLFSFRRLD